MGLFREVLGLRREERAIDKMALWGKGADIALPSASGVTVTQESAMRLVAVYACIRLVSGTIASLPTHVFRRQGTVRTELPAPTWLRMPNPETTWFEFVERIIGCLESDGNAYVLITARDALGFPAELWTLPPTEIQVRREVAGGPPVFIWNGSRRLTRYSPANPSGEVLHLKNFATGGLKGLSPIEIARQAIGLGLASEQFGSEFFGQGQTLSGVIEMEADDVGKAQASIDAIRENWVKRHSGLGKAHMPGVLVNAKWNPIAIAPEQAQFLETRMFQAVEIARLFTVPPYKIGILEPGSVSFASVEQQAIDFVQTSIDPRLVRLENYFDQLLPRGQYIKWETKGLLRGDSKAQAELMAKGRQWGTLTPNHWNELNDEPPIEGPYGDSYLVPAGYQVLAPEAPLPVPSPNGQGTAVPV